MSFPPFFPPRLTGLTALTQMSSQWLTRVISLYISTLETHICTRYLTRCVINARIQLWGQRGLDIMFRARNKIENLSEMSASLVQFRPCASAPSPQEMSRGDEPFTRNNENHKSRTSIPLSYLLKFVQIVKILTAINKCSHYEWQEFN